MSPINSYNREQLREQFLSAQPFPHMMIDGFLDQAFADSVAQSYPSYDKARELGHQFSAVNEHRKVQIVDYEKFPSPVQRLADALSSPRFMADISYITGIDDLSWDTNFEGAGMHETGNSGWLDVHVDFNYHESMHAYRRLNILVYLNPVWQEDWGGVLEIWDRDVKVRTGAFLPVHNRCVVFRTSESSWHGVTAVTTPDGQARKSFAAYYYTQKAPPGFEAKKHSTIFKARPDEYMKRHVLMPAEAAKSAAAEGLHHAKSAVKRWLDR